MQKRQAGDPLASVHLTRRQFLKYSGAAAASVAVLGAAGCAPGDVLPPALTRTLTLRRRLDMVKLRYDFYNLVLTGPTGNKRLQRLFPAIDAYVIVHFPPQTVLEETVPEGPDGPLSMPAFGQLKSRLGHESRLAFVLPPGVDQIPYDGAALLAWADYGLRVAPTALPPGATAAPGQLRPPRLGAPAATETAIELPWWLIISPNRHARFLNATVPVTRGPDERTELWHTRLAVADHERIVEDRDHPLRTGRAIWAADPQLPQYLNGSVAPPNFTDDGPDVGQPFPLPMDVRDRVDLIRNTSAFPRGRGYVPEPFRCNNLLLSALGGWLDASGAWPEGLTSLISWRHRATQGRDHYVRIIRKGYYLPTGHPAVELKISERKVERRNGISVAYLEQRTILVTRRQVMAYPGFHQQVGGRGLPFRSIRLATLVTPPITPKLLKEELPPGQLPDIDPKNPYVPYVAGTEDAVLYHCVGTDWEGRSIDFTTPLVFVEAALAEASDVAFTESKMGQVREAYNSLTVDHDWRAVPLHGQKVAFAPSIEPGDTSVNVDTLVLRCDAPAPGDRLAFEAADQPRCFPGLEQAQVRLGPVEQLTGSSLAAAPVVVYDPTYVTDGFDTGPNGSNKADLYLNLSNPPALSFPADRAGAVVTPNLSIAALSRRMGAVGGEPDTLKGGKFSPADWFGELGKILGGISLAEVIEDVEFAGGQPVPSTALQIVTTDLPDSVVTRIHWEPKLKNDERDLFVPGGTFTLDGRLVQDRSDPTKSTFAVDGDLRDVQLWMLGGTAAFLALDIRRVHFSSATGQKPVLEVDIRDTRFLEELGFIETLQKFVRQDGMSLDVTPTAIEATASVPIPSLELAVFSISNITFSTGLTIPLSGEPARMTFGFSSMSDPFHITVMGIGGGGWVELCFGLDTFEWLQIGFEAGAEVGVDFGPASGSIHIFAGFQFALSGDDLSLGGYVRMGGEVDVLGLISASIELRLELTYHHKELDGENSLDILHGRASIIVEVDVLMFSGEVEIECEKSFGGDPADPTFEDQVHTQALWDRYCDAFEPVGA